MSMRIYPDELAHFGIKGMKWGIRRYQNPDGTLTEEGKRRYSNNPDNDRVYKDLKKAVRNKRAIEMGKANRWMAGEPIGPNSKKLFDENEKKRKAYYNSSEFKAWNKKVMAADRKNRKLHESGKITIEEYDKRWKNLIAERPKKSFNDALDGGFILGKNGRQYINDFHKKGGLDVSIAYIQDLGYTRSEAEKIAKRILKSNYSLGMD